MYVRLLREEEVATRMWEGILKFHATETAFWLVDIGCGVDVGLHPVRPAVLRRTTQPRAVPTRGGECDGPDGVPAGALGGLRAYAGDAGVLERVHAPRGELSSGGGAAGEEGGGAAGERGGDG